MGKDGRLFNLIMTFSMIHVIMDGFTVYTVNHLSETPHWTNDVFHIVFYLSAMLFSAEILTYVANLCYPSLANKIRIAADSLVALYLVALLAGLLHIEYEPFNGTNASAGSAPTAGFILCFLFFLAAIVMILLNYRRIGKHIRMLLLPMLFLLIAVEVTQLFIKEFLFTGATVTVITLGFFMSLENPAAVLEKKIMMDALSGLGSRSSYELDIEEYEAQFLRDRTIAFTFVFIDINNLRSINGLYGQREGDTYIGKIAALLVRKGCGPGHPTGAGRLPAGKRTLRVPSRTGHRLRCFGYEIQQPAGRAPGCRLHDVPQQDRNEAGNGGRHHP